MTIRYRQYRHGHTHPCARAREHTYMTTPMLTIYTSHQQIILICFPSMMIFLFGLQKKGKLDLNILAPITDFCITNFFGNLPSKGMFITLKTRK